VSPAHHHNASSATIADSSRRISAANIDKCSGDGTVIWACSAALVSPRGQHETAAKHAPTPIFKVFVEYLCHVGGAVCHSAL